MSTLARHDTGTSLVQHVNTLLVDDELPQHVARIPRSVLEDNCVIALTDGFSHASSVLDADGHHSLRTAVTLTSQPSSSLVNTHEFHDRLAGTSHASARRGSVASIATFRGPSSPRKPIPSQWLPVNSGPNSSTAQRAKERDHKKGSLNSSPVESKTLSSTRSLADLSKAHAADGASFLTKKAHMAVESDLAASPTARSPFKQHRTSVKPAWNSPNGSPRRDSPQQQSHLIIKTSPIRTAVLGAGEGTQVHRRGNSVATSIGDSVYHSAESSPVRGSVDSESYAEPPEHISELELSADDEYEQASSGSSHLQISLRTPVGGTSTKPSLRIEIPATGPSITTGHKSAGASPSTSSGVPWSPTSASSLSRIPRAAGAHAISAHGPTLSSTLKRVQPAKSLTSLKAKSHIQTQDTGAMQSDTTPAASGRQAHFDDICTKKMLSKHRIKISSPRSIQSTATSDVSPISAHSGSASGEDAAIMPEQANFSKPASVCSRASSLSTVKAATSHRDPFLADSAIIYSKKPGACGTTGCQTSDIPHIVVMMAHNIDTGTFNLSDRDRDTHGALPASLSHTSLGNTSPVRGRAAQFVPTPRRHAESSEHSLHSSLSSDLRATAPDFVPQGSTPTQQENSTAPVPQQVAAEPQQLDQTTDLLGPMKYELDMYGIPWFYYMYQVQIAYNEGFQKGRNKSPKKHRQKKSNPARGQPSAEASQTQRAPENAQSSSSMPPPASTVPLAEQRAQRLSEVSVEGAPDLHTDTGRSRPSSPFRAQNDLIDRQSSFRNMIITERPLPGIDLTTIRNVPASPRSYGAPNNRGSQYQHRCANNRSDNGLYTYRGRGLTGLRMHDTVPFPAPMPPPGRPAGSMPGKTGCGVIDIVYAAEHVGGDACHECEPDHPLD